jgi:hypothetical protein
VIRDYAFGQVTNFRDLGGYQTGDGRRVRWGRLFRSNSLALLTEEHRAAFAALGIKTVIDFRRPGEVTRYGRIPYDDVAYFNIAPVHRPWEEVEYDEAAGIPRFLTEQYLALAIDGRGGWAEAIRLIGRSGTLPAVVHCYAGKDRTGVFAAIVLGLLGVSDHDIALDYQRSEEWAASVDLDIPAHFIASPAEAMHMFLDALRQRYESMSGYADFIGLSAADRAALSAALLESPDGEAAA